MLILIGIILMEFKDQVTGEGDSIGTVASV